jgi:hypothetical protein
MVQVVDLQVVDLGVLVETPIFRQQTSPLKVSVW